MTEKQISPGFLGSESIEPEASEGLISNVLELPESQRRLLNWMITQREVSLREVAAHFSQDEAAVFNLMNMLIRSGFVQESNIAGEPYYRIDPAAESRSQPSQNLWQNSVTGNPLVVITNPSGDYAVRSGSSFDLCVTISNQGGQSAVIDVFIDEASQPVRQWCNSPYERIALGPNSSGEIIFQFQVPVQILPGIYNYLLVTDAPQHYPEAPPVRHAQRLQVLPKTQDVEQIADPTFILQPSTNSTNPAILRPRETLQIQALIHNRSDQVDRFRLTCPDVDRSWFTVRYPEGLETQGLVSQTDGLALNPDAKGQIQLELHLPQDMDAGRYFPTVRLYSDNHPDLVLMDVVYLQILPTYPVTVELHTLSGRARGQAGQYEILLTNQGNIEREILLSSLSTDDEELCTYSLTPEHVVLPPKGSASVDLRVKPTKWWRRPFFRKQNLNFAIALEDAQQLPLSNAQQASQLVWEPRPWWQLLLMLLLSLGLTATLVFLIWWFFFKPLASSQIVEFGSEANVYQAGEAVRLKWRIRNPRQIRTLRIVGRSPNGIIVSELLSFDFSQGIPRELKSLCTLQTELVCRNVGTDARKPGDYIFEIQVFPFQRLLSGRSEVPSTSLKTDTIQIQPSKLPKIIEFDSSLPNPGSQIILHNWKIINPDKIQELRLIGRASDKSVNSPLQRYDLTQGIPEQLKSFCTISEELICQKVPTQAAKAGEYIFELSVVPKQGQGEASDTKTANTIKIEPPQAKILSFKINGQEASNSYLVQLNPKYAVESLTVSWKVESGPDSKVELLPTPGSVTLEGSISYPLVQKPGSQNITLQVTNAAGQKISKSVTVEVFDATAPTGTSSAPVRILAKPSASPFPQVGQPAAPLNQPAPSTQAPATLNRLPPVAPSQLPNVPAQPAASPTSVPAAPSPTSPSPSTPEPAAPSPTSPSPFPTDSQSPSEPESISPSDAPPQLGQ